MAMVDVDGSSHSSADSQPNSVGLVFSRAGFLYMGAHWRHLANTTEPSTSGGDAALYLTHPSRSLQLCCLKVKLYSRPVTNSLQQWKV